MTYSKQTQQKSLQACDVFTSANRHSRRVYRPVTFSNQQADTVEEFKACDVFKSANRQSGRVYRPVTYSNQQTDTVEELAHVEINGQPIESVDRFKFFGYTIGARKGVVNSGIARIRGRWIMLRDLALLLTK